jgi:hypothetical protein
MTSQGQGAQPLDPYWQAVCDFLGMHAIAPSSVVAPREFGNHLRGAIPYQTVDAEALDDVDCIVFHKGMLDRLPRWLPSAALRSMVPIFANEVFVIYGRDFPEPMMSAAHVRPFLEKIGLEEAGSAEEEGSPRPLLVYTGDGRLICRDVQNRKLIVPSRHVVLIGALMARRSVISSLREAVAPAVTGARKVLDYGAGVGLFAMAANELMSGDAGYVALEHDDIDRRAMMSNVELAGLLWRTKFIAARPARLDEMIEDGPTAEGGRFWLQEHRAVDPATPCDVLHIDLDAGLERGVDEWRGFIERIRTPAVVLTRGLASRRPTADASPVDALEDVLRGLGYEAGAPAPRAVLGSVAVWRRRGRARSWFGMPGAR